jgi:Phage capsid family
MTRPFPFLPPDDPHAARDNHVRALMRSAVAVGLSRLDRVSPLDHVTRTWPSDRLAPIVTRAAQSPTTIAGTPDLARVVLAYLDALIPASAGAALLAKGIKLDFNHAASIGVPAIAIPTNADFVAESAPIPVLQSTTSAGPTLSPRKIAAITSASGELLRNPSAEDLLRAMLIEATAPAVDRNLFSANAGDTIRPAGLLAGIAASAASSASDKIEALSDDLQTIARALAPISGDGGIVLIAAPAQAVALRTRPAGQPGWPILMSAALADKTLIGVGVNALVSAVEGAAQIDASKEAEVHYETNPQPIVGTGGVVATPVGSVYQTDSVALRVKLPVTWALRNPRGLCWLSGVVW